MRTKVPLSATPHDIGMSIHRTGHEQFSLVLAAQLIQRLLGGLYDEPVLTIMTSETLHAIIAHRSDVRCLTVEAGCVKVGDEGGGCIGDGCAGSQERHLFACAHVKRPA
jgi:metal-dependent HD superfamily phosphatase/phosphodiesterase